MNNNNKQPKRKMDKIYERKSKCPKTNITSNQRNETTEQLSIISQQMLPRGGVTDLP